MYINHFCIISSINVYKNIQNFSIRIFHYLSYLNDALKMNFLKENKLFIKEFLSDDPFSIIYKLTHNIIMGPF